MVGLNMARSSCHLKQKTSGFALLQKKSHWNFFGGLQSGRANPQKIHKKTVIYRISRLKGEFLFCLAGCYFFEGGVARAIVFTLMAM